MEENLQTSDPTSDQGSTDQAPSAALQRARSIVARLKRLPLFRTRRHTIITLLLGVPLVLCLGSWLFGLVAFADAASLAEMKGIVQTRHEDQTRWQPTRLNQLMWREDRVRTGSGSSARLAQAYDFVEFSEIRVEDGSIVVTGVKRADAPVGE